MDTESLNTPYWLHNHLSDDLYRINLSKRPPNSFMLFSQVHRKIVSDNNPKLENRKITKMLSYFWERLGDNKNYYIEISNIKKKIILKSGYKWYNPKHLSEERTEKTFEYDHNDEDHRRHFTTCKEAPVFTYNAMCRLDRLDSKFKKSGRKRNRKGRLASKQITLKEKINQESGHEERKQIFLDNIEMILYAAFLIKQGYK